MNNDSIIDVPLPVRRRKALITLFFTLFFIGLVVFYAWTENLLGYHTLLLIPFFLLGVVQSIIFWRTKQLNPDEEKRKAAEKAEKIRKQEEFQGRWYVRYPMSFLFLYGAWHFQDRYWLCIATLVMAAIFACEISILLILAGIAYFLFQGIASLPVSVAVIIGAVIIANAIKN